jgi:hypothetical protein
MAMDGLAGVLETMEAAEYPSEIVSGGGTGTYFASATRPPLNETQAGFLHARGRFPSRLGARVRGGHDADRVGVSRQADVAVIDTGEKGSNTEDEPPPLLDSTASITFVHEEHMGLAWRLPATAG